MAAHDRETDELIAPERATTDARPVSTSAGDLASLVGRVIDSKYVVREVLGRGGMGVVVRAHHLGLDQPVALKFLLGATPAASVRFQREARIVFQLSGEHVVRLFDVGTLDGGAPYLVMELVRGETLAQRILREGPLPIPTAIDFVLQACVGVAEAHRASIVHRDLKPSNLMLTTRADGTPLVKVLDFGIAKIAAADADDGASADAPPASVGAIARLAVADTVSSERPVAQATRGTAVVGTPFYMSPEQIERPTEVDARSDVWSLGVVLHELVLGKVPFDGVSLADVAAAITERPPTLAFGEDAESRALDAIVRKCLARDAEHRYQDVAKLAAALAPIAGTDAALALADEAARVLAHPPTSVPETTRSLAADPKTVSEPLPLRRRPRYMLWTGLAVAALAAGSALVWFATRDRSSSSSPTSATASSLSSSSASSQSSPPSSSSFSSSATGTCPPGMIFVPAGSFTMGLPKGAGLDRASPERQVTLSAYCIDRTEVTVDAYQHCVDTPRGELRCTPAKTTAQFRADDPPVKPVTIDQCNAGVEGRGLHPVNCVDWHQAMAYCQWATGGRGRLPTEAQWERAARGTDGRTYPWGEQKPSIELVNGNDEEYRKWRKGAGLEAPKPYYRGSDGFAFTAPVGSFPKGASAVGALDMAGNVLEWVADYYTEYDPDALVDPYVSKRDPRHKNGHPIRGGGWPDNQNKTTYRTAWMHDKTYPDLGFRCASPPDVAAEGAPP